VTAPGKNTNTQIVGTVPEYLTVRNLKIELGSFITPQNVQSAAKVAVLGPTARDDLFGANAANVIGQTIRINSISFKIIGVTQAKGGTGFGNADDMIFIPLSAARQYLTGGDSVSAIHVQAQSQEVMKQVQNDITTLLLNRHNIIDPAQADFSTLNQEDIVAAASSVANTFTILLAAIASISLLVGGIGIMNMMLTSVTERTREIGLRKAIGAHSFDISLQFLTEAITLTFLGGLVGIALGFLAAVVSTQLFNLPAQVSFSSVLLAFGVSAVIGITFGYYPARRAAKLNPIEALRYE
jgi:putative ABC transport system permease protein